MTLPPLVISIQSQVVYGHVGNSAAVYPMQAAGVEVAAVPTTLLSNHPHYPTLRGQILDAALVADLLVGVEERGLVQRARIILTGYLGSPDIARAVAGFIARARKANPALLVVCDPVMGDDDMGIFVDPGLIPLFRDVLVPMADIITPNNFEVELLAQARVRTRETLLATAGAWAANGPRTLVATGCRLADTPDGVVETILCQGATALRIDTPRLPIRPCGTGDLVTALMTAGLAQGLAVEPALRAAVAGTYRILERTQAAGAEEMQLLQDPAAGQPLGQAPGPDAISVSGPVSGRCASPAPAPNAP